MCVALCHEARIRLSELLRVIEQAVLKKCFHSEPSFCKIYEREEGIFH